ncbi:TonB-dependent receptor family protein [Flagellimonas zhangzhouensis]|uniref:Iron complex outermembrane recepter protein n=1 Tax=Flagellimonas zhangzhouensis TaxID=1073328 RepID=A0A1H2V8L5_9FLAO|nr:TonB-dependent receptor [Allomuricauda zhangzhouensis]SDQ09783.1 iron complex outermembrane recepter protein [Allomuricauda zhangzhouensis]SDW64681.1 iron complex outermembrane recepter protein [Allomuricauda zhangzhouensis]
MRVTIAFICFLLPIILIAQISPKDSITQLEEVILTQESIPKKATGITPSSTISTQSFERFNPTDIPSAMNQISGVYILSGAINTNRITVRGIGARTPYGTNKLRMYFNGIPVTNGTGSSTIEAYDFENLGSVEVIKGPKGTVFGSNLGGAILLDTKPSVEDETQLLNSFSVGSYNMLKDNLTFSHSEKDFKLSLSYNHMETDGYRQNNQFNRDGILLNSQFKTGEKSSIAVLVNYIDYTAHIASSINQTYLEEDPTRAASNWLAAQGYEANKYLLTGLSHTFQFSEKLENTTSIFYTYLDHYEPRPFNILDEYTNGFGLRTNFAGNWGKSQFTFGGELYKDEYHWGTFENLYQENDGNGSLQGDPLSNNKEFRRQFNLFGTFTYLVTSKLSAQLGLNLNKTFYDFRDLFNQGENNASAERDFDAILLPNLGLNYQMEDGKIYANISRGFSNPSLEETLTPNGIINPDIAQETGVNYELGSEWLLFQKRLSANVTVYRMNVKNLLVSQRVGEDQYIGRNAGKTRHQGLELDLQYRGKLSQTLILTPYLSYTLNDHSFVDFVDGDNDYSGNPLTGVPMHRISSGLDVQHSNGLQLNLTHQFVDKIPLTDANSAYSDAFNVFHAKLGYRTSISQNISLGLNARVNNIFDSNYAQSVLINAVGFGGAQPRYFYPGNGRNYFGGVKLNYVF